MVTEFVISRKEWLRGEGMRNSALLRKSDGKRCCVGIFARACGAPDASIIDRVWPRRWDRWAPEWLFQEEEFFESYDSLAAVNDKTDLPDAERERVIAAMFAAQGITVTFTD